MFVVCFLNNSSSHYHFHIYLPRYGYAVQDGETGNDFNQQEQSNGDEVRIMLSGSTTHLLLEVGSFGEPD